MGWVIELDDDEVLELVLGDWNGAASRFSDAQWASSCILDRADCDASWRDKPAKQRYGLPIKDPGASKPNPDGVHAAAGRIGQVKACPDATNKAKGRLRSAYSQIGETPPDSIAATASDSRPGMKELLEKLAKALKLDGDVDEEKVLEAITELADREEPEAKLPSELVEALDLDSDADADAATKAVKSLAEKASKADKPSVPKGKELLDKDELATLRADAKAGREARDELHQGKFDQAFANCLDEKRVDARDETKERYQKLYDKAPEETLETLENLPKLLSDTARGSGARPSGPDEIPAGLDEERYELHEKVVVYMREHRVDDYEKALEAVVKEEAA